MEKETLEHFRVQLLAKQAEIEQAMEKTLEGMTGQNSNIPDPNDRATIESDRGFELRIRDREKKLLKKIKEALVRIDDGVYGICAGCGEEIGVKRLEARPVTDLCIDCKTLQENKEKSMGQ
ncbi:MAG TPA: RNA polymerase-binding protein DksA [Desulfobulbaceae bacterium]|nr:RNA polymerase-binding protein DksA [Desulfobulbaceae bacterium]